MKPTHFVRFLAKKDEMEVEDLFRHGPNMRTRQRAQAVRLSAMGYTAPTITGILGCHPQSVHNWLNAFDSGGVQALLDKPKSGRPLIATPDYRVRLVKAVKTNPKDLGYPFTVWTVTRLRAHLAMELRILLGDSRLRQIMKEEGLVFKRPKHSLEGKRDPKAFAEIKGILDALKKKPWNPVAV
jgi:transposase